jgi:signal transduction histidine kinase/ligand-binding sensor domain-containing protein
VFNKSNTPGIQSNQFTTLYEDAEGNLWIGSLKEGLTKYSRGTFTNFPESKFSNYNIMPPIAGERGPGEWIANLAVLDRLRNQTGSHQAAEMRELEEIQRTMGTDSEDQAGLVMYRGGRRVAYTRNDGLSSLKIIEKFRDQRGNLWLGTEDAGLNRFRDGKFTVYRKKDGLPSDRMNISAVCEDRQGALWFAINQTQLYRLKDGKLQFFTAADGLPEKKILTIYEDREGSIWIGGDGGLMRYRQNVLHVISKRDGLFEDNTYPIMEDRAGSLWIGTWPGLNQFREGKFVKPDQRVLRDVKIVSLYEDSEGVLWIGTYGPGVFRLKDGLLTRIKNFLQTGANGWLAITQDRTGALWFGTTQGLFKYDRGALTRLTTDDGLPSNQINAIFEDKDGGLWLGTLGGAARLKDNKFTVYTEREGLSANHVRSFHQDEEGTFWIGTYDGGLNRLKDGRFTRYTTREGMFDNGVFRILDDNHGNFWMSSNRGIYRASRRELEDFAAGKIRSITTVGYGKGDGMLDAECNGGAQPAGIKTRDGRLWFPTQKGVAVIDPKTVGENSAPPPVLIEEFLLDDQEMPLGAEARIQPGRNRFEIRYTALSFIKSGQVRFKYKMEGLEDNWVDAGARRSTNYSHIPPGHYTFRVIAANSDGVWNNVGASLGVVVLPPFYRTWWFTALLALSAAGAGMLFYHRRISALEARHAAQEAFSRRLISAQEAERKRIAAGLHDSLGQQLLVIKNWALIGLNLAPENGVSREPLGEISAASTQAIEEVREVIYDLRPYQLDKIGLAATIRFMIEKVAAAAGIEFQTEFGDIDGLFSVDEQITLYRIVQECVNNIVKHSGATAAKASLDHKGGVFTIRIEDNGRGFASQPEKTRTKGGFGLEGMRERVRMLGGRQTVQSTPEGVVVQISIDLNRKI